MWLEYRKKKLPRRFARDVLQKRGPEESRNVLKLKFFKHPHKTFLYKPPLLLKPSIIQGERGGKSGLWVFGGRGIEVTLDWGAASVSTRQLRSGGAARSIGSSGRAVVR